VTSIMAFVARGQQVDSPYAAFVPRLVVPEADNFALPR
jgi:hypothetical protein